jgi:hypothetical protein
LLPSSSRCAEICFLARDLSGKEDFDHFQKRPGSIPTQLEEYFEKILGRVDKIYEEDVAQIFLLAVVANQLLPLYALNLLAKKRDDPEVLECGVPDD